MSYILIVDDDEDFSVAAAKVLSDAGHDVHIEFDIPNAERSMRRRKPDLVILDVMFPESISAGFALARKMRLPYDELRSIPILVLTAVNSRFPLGFGSDNIEEALPVNDFLEKPVDLDTLSNRVARMLDSPNIRK